MNKYSFEVALAMAERTIKRLWLTTLLLIVLLVASNAAWLYYESQFDTVETTETITVEQDNTDGINNYIGNDGDINNNGETDNNKNDNNQN